MKCSICNQVIVLKPSAKERARRYGGKPSDYTKLFTTHSACAILQRAEGTLALMRQISARKP